MVLFRKKRFCTATSLLGGVVGATERSAAARKSPVVTGVPPLSGWPFSIVSRYALTLLPAILIVDCAPFPSQPTGDSALPTPGPLTMVCAPLPGSTGNTL